MLGSGGEGVVSVWEGWEDGEGHGCEVAKNIDYSEVDYKVEDGAFVLLSITRDL